MADPITLAIAAGTAAATFAGAAGTIGAGGYQVYKDHKEMRKEQKKPRAFSMSETTSNYYQKGGNERVAFGADGSIMAVGSSTGDWSCGYSSTTRTITTGSLARPSVYGSATTGFSPPPVGYGQPNGGQLGYGPAGAVGLMGHAFMQPAPPAPQIMLAQNPVIPAPQVMPAQTPVPWNYGRPPPSYAQSEKQQSRKFFGS